MNVHTAAPVARAAMALGAVIAFIVIAAPSAVAAEGNIGYVEPSDKGLTVMYSVPGVPEEVVPDVKSISVQIEGQDVPAKATLAGDTTEEIRRTSVLALDVSNSMKGEKFAEAKAAARTFVEAAPRDLYVGIVVFADDVEVLHEPTLERAAAISSLDRLTLTRQTQLYAGVEKAVALTGSEGQRSVLVLSDGADTSGSDIADLTAAVEEAEVQVDVVALSQSGKNLDKLESLAAAGSGTVLEASDPEALSQLFQQQAEAFAKQVVVTAELPEGMAASQGTLSLSIEADGQVYTDSAFVTLREEAAGVVEAVLADPRNAVATSGALISPTVLLLGLGGLAVGSLVVLLGAFGVIGPKQATSVEEQVAAYGRTVSDGGSGRRISAPQVSVSGIKGSARAAAEKALAGNKGMESKLAGRLEAAGMAMKPAEWLLLQVGVAFGSALLGMLFGSFLLAVIFLAAGLVLPTVYLGFKKSRRVKAFNNQLADTLQLMAGSLSAGLSLVQSADTVVREGSEPMTSEFKRALVEARLGVPIEDGFESIAHRMQSQDFAWVVMAVRIQREVGGNLSEVLTQVAATIRERAYLRRQVKSLSAEGVLSAWIVGGLPVVVLLFLLVARPGYLAPMLSTGAGWIMLGAGAVMMAIGAFWLRTIVRMEV